MHLLGAVLITALVFPFLSPARRQDRRQAWSADLLKILGVRLSADAPYVGPGSLIVSNHVSWLDIFVINALFPSAFVSKAEVRDWPLAGWLAARHETVFLRRGSRGHARLVNGEIATLLNHGRHVTVFPEGTTTDGSQVLGFHGALLQAAVDTGAPLQPLAIAYRRPDGSFTRAPAYDDDVSLLACLKAIVAEPAILARIRVAPALSAASTPDRKTLARLARDSIVAGIAG